MKKLFKLLCAAVAVATMATVAVNAEETLLTTNSEYTYNFESDYFVTENEIGLEDIPSEVKGDVILNAECGDGDVTGYSGDVTNIDNGTGEFCIKEGGQVWYTFNAPSDGTYTVALLYVATSEEPIRGTGWAFDSTDSINSLWCEFTDSFAEAVKWVWFDVDLTAGDHTLYFTCPEGFDNDTIKTIGLWQVAIVFDADKNVPVIDPAPAPEDEAEEDDADGTIVEDDAEEEIVIAPATADLAVIAIVALGAYVVAKKH